MVPNLINLVRLNGRWKIMTILLEWTMSTRSLVEMDNNYLHLLQHVQSMIHLAVVLDNHTQLNYSKDLVQTPTHHSVTNQLDTSKSLKRCSIVWIMMTSRFISNTERELLLLELLLVSTTLHSSWVESKEVAEISLKLKIWFLIPTWTFAIKIELITKGALLLDIN